MKRFFYSTATIFLFSICVNGHLSAQSNNPFFQRAYYVGRATTNNSIGDTGESMNALLRHAAEDASQRTVFSSCYKTSDGKIIYKYSTQPVNYYNVQKKLVPIQIKLQSCTGGWVAAQQPNPCYFYLDRSTGITTENGDILKFNKDTKINDNSYQQQLTSVSGANVNLTLNNSIHKQISFLIGGIKTNYTIDSSIGNIIEISEEVDIPQGAVLMPDKKNGNKIHGMWRGDYELIGADGNLLARFSAPLCYDAKESGCVGYYHDSYVNGKHILYTVVPSWWLSQAKYPITIDPTVMGPVSRWDVNKRIPSDLYPNFYTDSILVTVPGKITITRLYASFCFITNLTNSIYINYGRIFFRTKCGKTPILQCDSANSSLPGTCYLDTISNNNDFGPQSFAPLTCCLSPSCSPQSFYFVVGLSRDCSCPPNAPDSAYYLWSPSIFDGIPYPFYAYIVGETDQATWSVLPNTTCSNQCTLTLNANAKYGVPPYTITHPWALGSQVFGTSASCNSSQGGINLALTIPGCPTYCGSTKTLSVPAPIIYDACGDTVQGLTAKTITINPVPKITTSPDSVNICSGVPLNIKISSCVTGTNIKWKGSDNSSGTDSTISYIPTDTTNNTLNLSYIVSSSYNGCNGNTDTVHVTVNLSPTLSVSHDTTIVEGKSVILNATSNGIIYNWSPAYGLSCTDCPSPIATPSVTTTYYVTVTGADGCPKTDTVTIDVIPQDVSIPNIFTPNGDNKNDEFYIKNLQYYPNSHLIIYDRWGKEVYESSNYPNNWNGGNQSDGVYYYVLTLPNSKKHDGFVEILR